MYLQGSPGEIQTPTHLNLIRPNMTAPKVVIAQQYSPATFGPLRFPLQRKKNSARVYKDIISF
jgi:hypothetical protein